MTSPKQESASLEINDPIVNRSPVFYGWIILFVGTLGYIMTSPGQTYVISVVLEPLMADLEISRSLVRLFGPTILGVSIWAALRAWQRRS